MTTQFDGIYHGLTQGKIRIAASGMAWKGSDSEAVVTMQSGDIRWAQWIRVARNFQLRVGLVKEAQDRSQRHRRETFDGFHREDHEKLSTLLKNHFAVTLEAKETSHKGWNWGVTDFQGEDLAFLVSDKTAFELPMSKVANSNIAGKTEVSLEFNAPQTKSKNAPDEMVEIRFYVPGTQAKNKDSQDGSQRSDNEDDDEEEVSAAQVFHDMIKDKANIGQVTGDIVLNFDEVLVLTPRGRYDMDLFKDFLRLRGKTYDYKILYSSISRIFMLPKDDLHILIILGLSTPIRQGQTRYQYLVMQFERGEEITAELNLTEEELAQYEKLEKRYAMPAYEAVSSIFRGLTGKKITGTGKFKGGDRGVKANLKAIQGDLFMLEKYIFFVSKQPTLIELSDVHQVVFARVGASVSSARTFDLKVVTRAGPEFVFTSINKEEREVIETHLTDRKVKVRNDLMTDQELLKKAIGDDSDEDMASIASDDDDGPRQKSSRGGGGGGGGEDEDSEEDEDFRAESSDEGSPSESDSDDSGAATVSDASGDLDFTKKAKKPKKKKETDGKKRKAAAADGMDVDGGEASPKKKKKAKAKSKDEIVDSDVDVMDVDEDEKPKPKPKPKPAKKKTGEEDEPPKKKIKKSDE